MTYYMRRSASHTQVRLPLTKFRLEHSIILKPYLEPVPETLLVLKQFHVDSPKSHTRCIF